MSNLAEKERMANEAKRKAQAQKEREKQNAKAQKKKDNAAKRSRRRAAAGNFFESVGDFFSDHGLTLLWWLIVTAVLGLGIVVSALQIAGYFVFTASSINTLHICFYIAIGALVAAIILAIVAGHFWSDYGEGQYLAGIILSVIVAVGVLVVGILTLAFGYMKVKRFYVDNESGVVYAEVKSGCNIWHINEDKTEVTLMLTIDGMRIDGINAGAAKNNGKLEKITFENAPSDRAVSVYIGKEAFKGCSRLSEVNFGSHVKYNVSKKAFQDCARLQTFNVGSAEVVTYAEEGDADDEYIFWKSTKAEIILDGGKIGVLQDSVGKVVIKSSSEVVFSKFLYENRADTFVFEEGFDFDGNCKFKSVMQDMQGFSYKNYYYSVGKEIYIPRSVTHIPEYILGGSGDEVVVRYAGTEAEWNAISIAETGNENYKNGKVRVSYGTAYQP